MTRVASSKKHRSVYNGGAAAGLVTISARQAHEAKAWASQNSIYHVPSLFIPFFKRKYSTSAAVHLATVVTEIFTAFEPARPNVTSFVEGNSISLVLMKLTLPSCPDLALGRLQSSPPPPLFPFTVTTNAIQQTTQTVIFEPQRTFETPPPLLRWNDPHPRVQP